VNLHDMAAWALASLCIIGCSSPPKDDATGGAGASSPVGGWASGDLLYACFAEGGALGVGDQRAEAEALNAGSWDAEGSIIVGADSGTWSIEGGTLTLGLDCSTLECGPFDYERDDSLRCDP
jgi:hypothetical protein